MRVQKKPGAAAENNGLANAMKLVISLVFTATFALLNLTAKPQPQPVDVHLTERAAALAPAEEKTAPEPVTPAAPTVKPFDAADPSTWPKCAEGEIVRADNGQCAKAAAPAPDAAGVAAATGGSKSARVPVGVHDIGGYGDCAAEIAKYNWGQSTALAVSRAESGLRPGVINNNPGTGDYSIGCFQVNIAGRNAINRPPQEQLIDAATNVRWAYNNYVSNGSSFIGQWGVCRSKVSCY